MSRFASSAAGMVGALASIFCVWCAAPVPQSGAAEAIPHAQNKPPGPALSPAEAIAKMTVPEGFTVELVASEPDIVNPVAMTFDERGRIWITESLEYPRHEPGPGRDRVKILEDTDGDGRADKFTVFAEGFNIPSGIAVGHGGVWLANAPDILFLQDTDGDDRADRQEVIVTGFGRDDTHELPNSLTWGPDGWLYGLNGVFNRSRISYRGQQHDFTCALFRIHPRTRDFEIFCQGTSNPWGLAWDKEGSAFVSACVIDHLWHLTETGYYVRQGGPYPPFTSIISSIVKHRHQQAAYCGLHYFDSDAYPPQYREKLYMGNLHGSCINVDRLERDGATYQGLEEPDFLSAHDAWFMPVAQKTGPDGCLYILDWYDRYHCYQDASRDPRGVDRQKGRLYRVRYKDTPRAAPMDLAKESDDQLIARLASSNVLYRELAQRLLAERDLAPSREKLAALVFDDSADGKARMHALWSLTGFDSLDPGVHRRLLAHANPTFRAWGARAAGNLREVDPQVRDAVVLLAKDPSADVRLQVAIAGAKLRGVEATPVLLDVLAASGDDKLIPHIVWQNLSPRVERDGARMVDRLSHSDPQQEPGLAALAPKLMERLIALKNVDPTPIAQLFALLEDGPHADPAAARACLTLLAAKAQLRELSGERLSALQAALAAPLQRLLATPEDNKPTSQFAFDAALLTASWGQPQGLSRVRECFASASEPVARRTQALQALVATGDVSLEHSVRQVLSEPQGSPPALRAATLDALGRLGASWVSEAVLASYESLDAELQPKAIELLTQRRQWAFDLLDAIGKKRIPPMALNVNQVRQLLESRDRELVDKVKAQWGSVRVKRNPAREQVIADVRKQLRSTKGDPLAGQVVFRKVCGQCHKIYGEGQEVGPDITSNGRASFEQLLSNVLDPSLVIGAAYQGRIVLTTDGRALTGLVAEDNDQRIVLKQQGGKLETIPRGEIEESRASELSMMPEELEKQYQPQELVDLFAFLMLDKRPTDPEARLLPGAYAARPMEATDPARFGDVLAEFNTFVTAATSGERGLGIEAQHAGREGVLRTHPVSRQMGAVLSGEATIPAGKKSHLLVNVSNSPDHDWRLVVLANGKKLHDSIVGPPSTHNLWQEIRIDLTDFAGQKVKLELCNEPNDSAHEFAYWGRVEIVSE